MTSTHSVTPLSALEKSRLAAEIMSAYARVRWLLRRDSLPVAVATLRASQPVAARTVLLPDPAGDEYRLGRAVVRTIRLLPSGSRCLVRSLVLLRVLARRGVEGNLVIAVQPSESPGLDAHAWIEVDGRPLLAPAHDYGRLVTL